MVQSDQSLPIIYLDPTTFLPSVGEHYWPLWSGSGPSDNELFLHLGILVDKVNKQDRIYVITSVAEKSRTNFSKLFGSGKNSSFMALEKTDSGDWILEAPFSVHGIGIPLENESSVRAAIHYFNVYFQALASGNSFSKEAYLQAYELVSHAVPQLEGHYLSGLEFANARLIRQATGGIPLPDVKVLLTAESLHRSVTPDHPSLPPGGVPGR